MKRFGRKRPALFKSGQWHFHQDNAPVHNSIVVTHYLTKMGIKTVPWPPYSLDLAPCDFWLFPKLRTCRYEIIEMKEAVTNVIDTLRQEDFHWFLFPIFRLTFVFLYEWIVSVQIFLTGSAISDRLVKISDFVKKAYCDYFGVKLGNQYKSFASLVCCKTCVENLREWKNGRSKSMLIVIPMVWNKEKYHITNTYFCILNLNEINRKNNHHVKYTDVPSAKRPTPHGPDLPVPEPDGNL